VELATDYVDSIVPKINCKPGSCGNRVVMTVESWLVLQHSKALVVCSNKPPMRLCSIQRISASRRFCLTKALTPYQISSWACATRFARNRVPFFGLSGIEREAKNCATRC